MKMIASVEEAEVLLAQNKDLMIRMDNDFDCWVQMGVRDAAKNLVANGEKVAMLTDEVFAALVPKMGQVFCSEYFQLT